MEGQVVRTTWEVSKPFLIAFIGCAIAAGLLELYVS
jgi:hypothetical protein